MCVILSVDAFCRDRWLTALEFLSAWVKPAVKNASPKPFHVGTERSDAYREESTGADTSLSLGPLR